MILRDFNAKVEETVVDECTGAFELGDENEEVSSYLSSVKLKNSYNQYNI